MNNHRATAVRRSRERAEEAANSTEGVTRFLSSLQSFRASATANGGTQAGNVLRHAWDANLLTAATLKGEFGLEKGDVEKIRSSRAPNVAPEVITSLLARAEQNAQRALAL